jgi:choline dehydrogenase
VTAGRSRFDVVVAGGGTAGCVLAARLSEDPERTVCLVEAGPDYGPYAAGRWPADMLDGRRLAFSHAWETDREDRSQLRARILGGCSAHNACVLLEGPPADYDEWGPGWTYAELGPFLRRAREQFAVRVFDEDELSPWHRVFAGRAGGFVHEVNARGAVRWNAAFAYLDEARGRPNLTIRADTLVARVLLDGSGSRATGVETSVGAIDAETVVLAAGAYGSPGILLRSGVGPERRAPRR